MSNDSSILNVESEEELCGNGHTWDPKSSDDAVCPCLICGDIRGCAWCGIGCELGCCNDCLSPEAKKILGIK
jgi:hypothetical protein